MTERKTSNRLRFLKRKLEDRSTDLQFPVNGRSIWYEKGAAQITYAGREVAFAEAPLPLPRKKKVKRRSFREDKVI